MYTRPEIYVHAICSSLSESQEGLKLRDRIQRPHLNFSNRFFTPVCSAFTQINLFLIFSNQTKFVLKSHFTDWFSTSQNSIWFWMNQRMVNTIWFWLIERIFKKIFVLCSTLVPHQYGGKDRVGKLYTPRRRSWISIIQTKFRLKLHSSDWISTKRNWVWC